MRGLDMDLSGLRISSMAVTTSTFWCWVVAVSGSDLYLLVSVRRFVGPVRPSSPSSVNYNRKCEV